MPRTCKVCRIKFEPTYNKVQTTCSYTCAIEYAKIQREKQAAKDWKQEKKKIKESLKTTSDYIKEAQIVFNQWVRLRDRGKPCISCQKPAKKENAGHYRSVGSSPHLRFNELNNNLQCEYCNTYLHGNLINYRINLIKKIGIKAVEDLEQNQEPKHYTTPELILLKEDYKERIRKINQQID